MSALILVGFLSSLISSCAAFQLGYETSSYRGYWWEIIENDQNERCGWKRLRNEMDVDGFLRTFVTTKGLPDYIHIIDSDNLELAYLREYTIYHFERPPFQTDSKVTSSHFRDAGELPTFMIEAFEKTTMAESRVKDFVRGPKKIKTILPQGADYKEYGKKYAIVIGISDYEELRQESEEADKTRLCDLKYADDDATDFIKFLKSEDESGGGWLIYSFIDQEAKKQDIRRKLDDVLTSCKATDLIYVFFSGHGRATVYDSSEIYLLTYDSKYEYPYDGIPYNWLRNKIEESPAEHIIAFIDACRSGTIGFAKGGDNRPDTRFMGQLNVTMPNKIIFTSGRGSQQAFENDKLKNGVFTYFLIEGLSGKAEDLDRDMFVDLSELRDYVEEQVKSYTSSNKKMETQIPTLWERKGFIADDFPVAIRH